MPPSHLVTKKPSYGPAYLTWRKENLQRPNLGFEEKSIQGRLIQPNQTNLGCTTPLDMEIERCLIHR